ncbi:proto-oncogene Mas-like [Sphaerodactylus townsendi]|uniref:proto-oncogene Mas-like n=1 Tax=Sphaerodactylus townsendi TaxID=933632 RepID=UPI00202711BD|nr:proto-oncogene Mas-like [Sphaerodactylus townsendi]
MGQFFHTLHRIKKNDTELELWSINKSDFYREFRTVANIGMPFCILGLIGNGILFWLICCTIKKSRFTVYFANVAAGDFIILLHYFVAYLLIFLPARSHFYRHLVKLISLLFGSDGNVYFLTVISAERYIMVISPAWPQPHRPKHLTAILVVSLWTLSCLLTTIEYFLCHPKYLPSHIIGFLYCHTAIVLQYIIDNIVFLPVLLFCILGLFIKIQKRPPQNVIARLDISIMAVVFLHFTLCTILNLTVFANYLVAFMPSSKYRRASLILDCVDSVVNPFVFLFVGYWKKKGQVAFHVLIERSFEEESNSSLETQPDQEQA